MKRLAELPQSIVSPFTGTTLYLEEQVSDQRNDVFSSYGGLHEDSPEWFDGPLATYSTTETEEVMYIRIYEEDLLVGDDEDEEE